MARLEEGLRQKDLAHQGREAGLLFSHSSPAAASKVLKPDVDTCNGAPIGSPVRPSHKKCKIGGTKKTWFRRMVQLLND